MKGLEVFAQRRPRHRIGQSTLLFDHLPLHSFVERSHGEPFAEDLQGDTLANVALRAAVMEKRLIRPAQHVDEARRNGEAGRIDLLMGNTL